MYYFFLLNFAWKTPKICVYEKCNCLNNWLSIGACFSPKIPWLKIRFCASKAKLRFFILRKENLYAMVWTLNAPQMSYVEDIHRI